MFLREVGDDTRLKKIFLTFPVQLYSSDPNWIRPLDNDISSVFDPRKNPHFKQGEAIRWILFDESDQPIGRVAAFYERNTKEGEVPVGGMGFFECIEEEKAAFILFDACKPTVKVQHWVFVSPEKKLISKPIYIFFVLCIVVPTFR